MTENTPNYCQAVFPPPELDGAAPCTVCKGRGFTHERVSTDWDRDPQTGEPRLLLLPVFCPACGGCGRAGHNGCVPDAHGYPPAALAELTDGPPPSAADPQEDFVPRCPACEDRGWRATQAYRDDGEPGRIFARLPCGCTEHRIEPVSADDVE